MASFKILVVLVIAASAVSGQTNTFTKDSRQNYHSFNAKTPSYGQAKQTTGTARQSFSTFSGFGQNQQTAGASEGQQSGFSSFPAFGQNQQTVATGRQQGSFPSYTGFEQNQQTVTTGRQQGSFPSYTGFEQNQQNVATEGPQGSLPSFTSFEQNQQSVATGRQQGGFPSFPGFGQNQQPGATDGQQSGFPSLINFPGFGQNQQAGATEGQGGFQFPDFGSLFQGQQGQGTDPQNNIFNQFNINPFGEGFDIGQSFQGLFGQQQPGTQGQPETPAVPVQNDDYFKQSQ